MPQLRDVWPTVAWFTSGDWNIPAVAALWTAITYFVYRRYPAASATVAGRLHAAAGRVHLCVVAAMLLPLVVRLALVPWLTAFAFAKRLGVTL